MRAVNVTKRFGQLTALDGIDFEVDPGRMVGVIGRNGSGKTTLLEIIMTLSKPTSGHIEYPAGLPSDVRQTLGVILQQGAFPDSIKVGELLRLFSTYYKETEDIQRLVDLLDLRAYLKHYYRNLSGGTQQRVNLALAFINKPRLVVLDEPTTGLDPISREYFWNALRELATGATVFLSTHYMEEVEENCDDLIFLDSGTLSYFGPLEGFIEKAGSATLGDAYLQTTGSRNRDH